MGRCKNCGKHFVPDKYCDDEICSKKCFDKYVNYLNEEIRNARN